MATQSVTLQMKIHYLRDIHPRSYTHKKCTVSQYPLKILKLRNIATELFTMLYLFDFIYVAAKVRRRSSDVSHS